MKLIAHPGAVCLIRYAKSNNHGRLVEVLHRPPVDLPAGPAWFIKGRNRPLELLYGSGFVGVCPDAWLIVISPWPLRTALEQLQQAQAQLPALHL